MPVKRKKNKMKGQIHTLQPSVWFTYSPTTNNKIFLSDKKAEEYLQSGIPIFGIFKKYELTSKTKKKRTH